MAGFAVASRGLATDRARWPAVDPQFANGATQADLNALFQSPPNPALTTPFAVQSTAPPGPTNNFPAAGWFGLKIPATALSTSNDVALYAFADDSRVGPTGGVWGFNALTNVRATVGGSARAAEMDINNFVADSGSTTGGSFQNIFGMSIGSGGTKRPGAALEIESVAAPFFYGIRFNTTSIYSGGASIQSLSSGATQVEYEARVGTEANPRFQFTTAGLIQWGPGGASAIDANLYRASANFLQTDWHISAVGVLQAAAGAATQVRLGAAGPGSASGITFQAGEVGSNLYRSAVGTLTTDGVLRIGTIGNGLRVAEGANAKQGISGAMAAGSVVVANTSVTVNSRIMLTRQDGGTNPGAVYVSARTAGTSFTITSTNAADTGTVAYQIFEPA